MSNEWQLSEYSTTMTQTYDDGDVSTSTTTSDGSSITNTTSNTPSGGSTTTNSTQCAVNDFSYAINKDGTWERTMNITFTSTTNGITVIENTVSVSSGTWNLLGKIEEFKKNERVVFNTLSENITNSTTIAGNTDSSSESYTYANREEAEIMLVVEFKR